MAIGGRVVGENRGVKVIWAGKTIKARDMYPIMGVL